MDRRPEPINDHERTIAEALDSKLFAPGSSYESIVPEIVESMPFALSIADIQFLFNYAHWRLTQPAKKQPALSILPIDRKRSG
ncbi:MAG: hypothetical protein ABI833_01115 [Acidobacteriota bacterium]